MPRVEFDMETPVAPERVRAALIDFSDRRPEIWPGIHPSLYEVYEVGETSAEVKEGTKAPGMTVWARERYDWSDPQTVRWTVQESNFSTVGSYVAATITPGTGGGSRIHVEWEREPTTFPGRIVMFLIRATKGKPIRQSLEKGLARIRQSDGGTARKS